MTCKDCYHKEVCESICFSTHENGGCEHCYFYSCEVADNAERCAYFEAREKKDTAARRPSMRSTAAETPCG